MSKTTVAAPEPEDDKKHIRREAHIRTVRLGEIRISPAAQRQLNRSRVNRIVDALDIERLGTLTVSSRDGFYWLIDGQHRYTALKEYFGDGFEEWEMEAWCYFGLTEEQEAEKFLQHNEVLAVNGFDKFRVGVTAGRAVECDVDRIVRSLGLKVVKGAGPGHVQAVGTLVGTYKKYGPAGLAHTLATIRDSFGDRGFDAAVIGGVGMFRSRYDGRIDDERLTKKLSHTAGGVRGLLNRAYLVKEKTGSSLSICIAASVTDIYNAGLRGSASLGSWWKAAA